MRGRLVESRLDHGQALEDDGAILASDARDDALVTACERELARLRPALPSAARVRLVAEASSEGISSAMTVRVGGLSIVTTLEHVADDVRLLTSCTTGVTPVPRRPLPLLWRNGSAAVLLHEAQGHALEHGHAPLSLPEWLRVDIPLRMRRATFRDVPLLRMTHVRAEQRHAPFVLPDESIEVHLVEGGTYEPLTETVTIRIAAATLRGEALAPFVMVAPRQALRFLGAQGEPLRYPGVICSREGQELIVESHAPLLLTELA